MLFRQVELSFLARRRKLLLQAWMAGGLEAQRFSLIHPKISIPYLRIPTFLSEHKLRHEGPVKATYPVSTAVLPFLQSDLGLDFQHSLPCS